MRSLRMVSRRSLLALLLATRAGAAPAERAAGDQPRRRCAFRADFGAHPGSRTEWWYMTGALDAGDRTWGFQITFFRVPTSLRGAEASRFAAQQLLFAHAAVSDLAQGSCATTSASRAAASASPRRARPTPRRSRRLAADARRRRRREPLRRARDERERRLRVRSRARRDPARAPARRRRHVAQGAAPRAVQPLLQRGAARGARHARGRGRSFAVEGRAWLDHEWSDAYLDPAAAGWDWIGMNLDDGGALMAFRIRRPDGSTLWSGGSHRPRGGAMRDFADGEVVFTPGRTWTSAGDRNALSGRVAGRDAGRHVQRARAAGRPGARQPRQHRNDLLGRAVAAARRDGGASAAATSR